MEASRCLYVHPVALSMTASFVADGKRATVPQEVQAYSIVRPPQGPRMLRYSVLPPWHRCARTPPVQPCHPMENAREGSFPLACNSRASLMICIILAANTIGCLQPVVVRGAFLEFLPNIAQFSMCRPLHPVPPWRHNMQRRAATCGFGI